MARRLISLLAALVVLLPLASHSDPIKDLIGGAPIVVDHVKIVSVLPPGENGTATLDPATQSVVFGDHVTDQLGMYANLVYRSSITEADISTFFKDAGFNTVVNPANVERVEVVGPATVIFRDKFGVAHVYGQTAEAVAYGAGYVTAEDRMFQADLYRHAARGTLAELLGKDYIASDEATRREGYTEAELEQQILNLPIKFGADGLRIQRGLETFAAGFNQRIGEVLLDPRKMPVEYIGTGNLPLPWRATDTVAESVLLSRTFGEAAGAEVRNAALYEGLIGKFGASEAPKAFNDLRWLNDPAAATTVPPEDGAFTYPNTGAVQPAAIALPDHAASVYQGQVDELVQLSKLGLGVDKPASNAMLVAPSKSTTGHSLELGDPQVGYAIPQYLMEISLHGGGYDAAGMTFPGVSGFVLIGHGTDYAWTVTSGISDAVDVRAEKLCNPTGGAVAADSSFYLFNGQCTPMEQRPEVILAKGTPVTHPDQSKVDAAVIRVQRTIHGPVFARDTVHGVPVALVKQRDFWMREFDNAAAFGLFNFPDQIHNATDFGAAASHITVALNLYYADRERIGYWHTGRFPIRHQGVDTRLPTWGTGEWEWSGDLAFADQPHFISGIDNPAARSYTYNWNNKPSTGWANGDDTNWGDIQRVDTIKDQMDALLAGAGTMNRVDVINIMNNAATMDPRVAKLLPVLIPNITPTVPLFGQAVSVLKDWAASGAHRRDLDNDGFDENAAAIRIWDTWNEKIVDRIFVNQLGSLKQFLGFDVVEAPNPGGSAFFSGMFNHVLHVVEGSSASLPPQHDWLNGQSIKDVVSGAFTDTLNALGLHSPADFSAVKMPREEIIFSPQGAHAPIHIQWVNRGTWTHVAEVG